MGLETQGFNPRESRKGGLQTAKSEKTELQVLISESRISSVVKMLAMEIRQDYFDKFPLLVGILKGSFVFMADLIRNLDLPLEVDFISLASYGVNTRSNGQITLIRDLPSSIQGRHVLIVEDIIDTGVTIAFLYDYLRQKDPASIKLCALVDKPSRRQVPVTVDYLGFTIPNKFIVGYGLDWNEKYRNLRDIFSIEVEVEK